MSKYCPKCNRRENMEYHNFCYNCGTKLEEKKEEKLRCRCGDELHPTRKFCAKCGLPREEALKKDEQAPNPLASPPRSEWYEQEVKKCKDAVLIHGAGGNYTKKLD